MTMDNESEKKSMHEGVLGRRRLELQIASINAASRAVAVDMRKGQNEMRRRLQKYRNRQREISEMKKGPHKISMEEFIERQIRLQKLKETMNQRPFSSPLIKRMSKLINEAEGEKDVEEVNIDTFTDRMRSKADLRPSTALTCPARLRVHSKSQRGSAISSKRDIRYYEDDEIRDRGTFYEQLLSLRKKHEQDSFVRIRHRIDVFCGKVRDPDEDEDETWRPMGTTISHFTDDRNNRPWMKPRSRPTSSNPRLEGDGRGWGERRRSITPGIRDFR